MQRFDEHHMLREAQRRMRESEARATLHHQLHPAAASRRSVRRWLADALVGTADRLEPRRRPDCPPVA